MADSLNLSLWFPSFDEPEILPRVASALSQFPFSPQRSGVTYLAIHPVSWNEPTIMERRFQPAVAPAEAAAAAVDLLHDDYAYVFDVWWDLWSVAEGATEWLKQPSLVKFIAQGMEFDDGTAAETGHIQIDFGLDTPFLHEELQLTPEAEQHIRSNVQQLVEFTSRVEKNSGASGRLLWSESEETLAQKLIARLQKLQ